MNDIEQIHVRNKRVEMDKAWETSLTRRTFIALVTYAAAWIFMELNEVQNPAIQACIPAGAYIASTLSLPWLKKMWLQVKR